MDLTIPYTFYPAALPHELAWGLFGVAILCALAVSVEIGRVRKPWVGLIVFVPVLLGLLVVTIIGGVVITFFIHDV